MSFIIGLATDKEYKAFNVELVKIENENMNKICMIHNHYDTPLQQAMNMLKEKAKDRTYRGLTALPEFKLAHDEYVQQASEIIEEMCTNYDLNKSDIDCIVFYGENLDCKSEDNQPHSLQMGSGKMLADLTGIKVVYGIQTAQQENAKNEVFFLSYLGNLFKSMIGMNSNRSQMSNNGEWIGTKVATRNVYRIERYGYADYKYDDMLNDAQISVQERKKVAQYDAWKRYGNQGRFGR